MLAGLASVAHAGAPLPVGGTVVQGAATISGNTNSTTVTQSSSRAVINWQSFDVGSGKSVVFNQPDAKSATLNRVTGSTTSTIAGQITSNGAVYLVNPNGIAITSTGTVNTAGGFVASTLDIADADFTAGKLNFAGSGASGSVTNAGHIAAGQGAYVALLGGSVSNSGTINVPYGTVGLGSGESIALDLNGNGFMQVAVPSALLTGSNALIANSGSIATSGGTVQLQAAVVKDAIRNVINMSGSINADSATGDGGTIHLIGGADTANMAGTVTVNGSLSARATGPTGNGGFIETSGATVNFTGVTVDTTSANGKTGNWLVDPSDLTVDAAAAATISTNLATSNVTLQTNFNGLPTGPGTYSGGPGDIYVNNAVSWSSTNTLTLNAYNNIYLNAAITAPTGGLTVSAGSSDLANPASGTIFPTAAVNIGTLTVNNGAWVQSGAALPSLTYNVLNIHLVNGAGGGFIRTAGGDGSVGNPCQIADINGLEGIGGPLSAKNFALTADIDASHLTIINSTKNFIPIFLTGSLNGQNHTISNLTVTQAPTSPAYAGIGLFSTGNNISNLNLTNVNVTGGYYVGGVAGIGSNISNVSVTGSVTGTNTVGGLVGYSQGGVTNHTSFTGTVTGSTFVGGLVGYQNGGGITQSWSSAIVSLPNGGTSADSIGGLVGRLVQSGSISQSYATGNVSGIVNAGGLVGGVANSSISQSYATGNVSGNSTAGGLVGEIHGASAISQSYATGSVSGGSNIGGLVGTLSGTTLSQSYASGNVSGSTYAGGLLGSTDISTISQNYASGNVSAAQYAGGLIGSLSSGSVTQSFASGNVTASLYGAGGLVAYMTGGSIDQVYASGVVNGVGAAGGLVALANGGTIARSYETGSVTGTGYVGGLIGSQYGNTVNYAYATGSVSGGAGLVGHQGAGSSASVANSYWDSYSTGQSAGCSYCSGTFMATAVTSDPSQSAAANYAYNFSAYGNFVAADWVQYNGQTRPFGAWEVPVVSGGSATINSGHALQLINSDSLSANYLLANNVDLSETAVTVGYAPSYSGMWASAGFVPLGTDGFGNVLNGGSGFSGGFYGANHTISGLTISRHAGSQPFPAGGRIGLFGSISTTASIANVGLSNVNVSGDFSVGALVGTSNGSISASWSSGFVSGTNTGVGGLIGSSSGSVAQSYSTAVVTNVGVNSSHNTGGLIGEVDDGTITQSYASGSVTGYADVGGLVGLTFGSITRSYATGSVNATIRGGGLVGTVALSPPLPPFGGNPGSPAKTGSVAESYATGQVTTTSTGSGLDGGGLVAQNQGTIINAYWDSYSTGRAAGVGSNFGTATNVSAITSDPSQSAAANYAYKTSAYSNFTPANWVFFDGQTRPFLASEIPTAFLGVTTINNSHQLQLIDASATTLGQSYVIGSNIYAQETGVISACVAAANCTPSSYSGMWAASGFVPIGTDGAGTKLNSGAGFTGSLNGQGFSIFGLTEKRSGISYTGLFGASAGNISNLGLYVIVYQNGGAPAYTIGGITGGNHSAALVGNQSGGAISNAFSELNVTGSNSVGGLIADAINVSVTNSTAQGSVTGNNYVGGLIGYQGGGSASNVSASGNVSAGTFFTGGLIAYQTGSLSNGTASGTVRGTNDVGGLVGYEVGSGSSITGSGASGAVNGSSAVGGLVGYAEGNISGSTASNSVTATEFTGGFVGRGYSGTYANDTVVGPNGSNTISNVIIGDYYTGGFAGYLDSGVTVTGSSTTGRVQGGGFTGGFAGSSGASISGSHASGTTVTGVNYTGGFIGFQGGGAVTSSTAVANVTSTDNFVGGFDGGQAGGSLTIVTASGTVNGVSYVGGLVGMQSGGNISLSSASGKVTSSGTYTGGLVGVETINNSIDQSFATGAVVASGDDVGGLIGFQDRDAIANNSYAMGNVTGANNVGGLIGYEVGGNGNDYATGQVTGNSFVGGLVGRAFFGGIGNSYATGAVNGVNYVGGLVGYKDGITVLGSDHATGSVTGTGDSIGGLVGYSTGNNDPIHILILNSYATGSVSGRDNVGGLIGYNDSGVISLSRATGPVTGRSAVGGLIGNLNSGLIDQVYASGSVSATGTYEGGLIGLQNMGTITNTYALGSVSGTASYVGGLNGYMAGGTTSLSYDVGTVTGHTGLGGVVGYLAGGTISNVVWNSQTTNLVNGYGFQTGGSFAASGFTGVQMQGFSTYMNNYPAFNFSSIWFPPNLSGENGMAIPHYPLLRNVP